MFFDNFIRCFDNFFQRGTADFFGKTPGTNTASNRIFINRPTWSVAEALGSRDGNKKQVQINHNRLRWYDSNLQRALVPPPEGAPRSMNLTKQELDQLETRIFDVLTYNSYSMTECDICLGTFKSGCKLKILPCKHSYHSDCIDKWLLQRPVCPRCRSGIRTGLRKQISDKKKKISTIQNGNTITPEIIERRRKINNNFYLKKREQRLKKLDNVNPITKKINNDKSLGTVQSKSEFIADDLPRDMSLARKNAVAAALKRASLLVNENNM